MSAARIEVIRYSEDAKERLRVCLKFIFELLKKYGRGEKKFLVDDFEGQHSEIYSIDENLEKLLENISSGQEVKFLNLSIPVYVHIDLGYEIHLSSDHGQDYVDDVLAVWEEISGKREKGRFVRLKDEFALDKVGEIYSGALKLDLDSNTLEKLKLKRIFAFFCLVDIKFGLKHKKFVAEDLQSVKKKEFSLDLSFEDFYKGIQELKIENVDEGEFQGSFKTDLNDGGMVELDLQTDRGKVISDKYETNQDIKNIYYFTLKLEPATLENLTKEILENLSARVPSIVLKRSESNRSLP
ncbi:MAG: hypothetical protein ABIL70_00835 [candidate division WOR-3 bacterium]